MELINDKRLTPTMERIRSGSTQLFREWNKDDHTFIGIENCDVKLNHENKEMFAELIDGKWYWVSGCSECNGKPRGHSYIECEKHDVCSSCGCSRKDAGNGVWGGMYGWTCNSCKEANDSEMRREAFEKLDGEDPDCSYQDKIICPHCGSEVSNDDIHESQDMECYVCEGEFSLEVEWTPSYSTTVKGDRIKE